MKDDPLPALLPKACEAVITEDGKVKLRLKTYETVIGGDSDVTGHMPRGAVNDTDGNLNAPFDGARTAAKVFYIRYSMYVLLVLALAGFFWSVYLFIAPATRGFKPDREATTANTVDDQAAIGRQLERIANRVIEDGSWNEERIKSFLRYWNNSDPGAREGYKRTAWYQQFTFRLHNRYQQDRHRGAFTSYKGDLDQYPLLALALATEVAQQGDNYAQVVSESEAVDYARLADEVKRELSKVEQASTTSRNAPSGKLETQTASAFPDVETSPHSKIVSNSVIDNDAASIPDSMPAQPISRQDIADILQRYAAAYEKGDLGQIASLFGVEDSNSGRKIVEQLKQNYQTVFDNSVNRKLRFQGLDWKIRNNQAVVNSDYNAIINLKNNKGSQTVTATANVIMNVGEDNITISRFQLLGQKVRVISPELNLVTAAPTGRAMTPTEDEMRQIIARLVRAYEIGDINGFVSLFAKDARTNDQSDLAGIKQDYQAFFSSTKDRKMAIKNLHWAFDKTQAHGRGLLEAKVVTRAGDPEYAMIGNIEIKAKRLNNKVLITHLYHTERSRP